MKQEFNIVFQIDKMTIFNVTYYTLGNNSSAHFSTNASKFVRNKRDFDTCGQCQESVLYGEALKFYKEFDKYHLKDLTQNEYDCVIERIEELKQRYNFIEKTGQNLKINFSEEVELSKLEPKPKIEFVSKKEQNEIDSFFNDFDR